MTEAAYFEENGTHLGVVSQDLFIANNKMYIISQNGGEDGMLVIANAETLKKEKGFRNDQWPTSNSGYPRTRSDELTRIHPRQNGALVRSDNNLPEFNRGNRRSDKKQNGGNSPESIRRNQNSRW